MDKIELMNGIIKLARPAMPEDYKLTSLDTLLSQTGMDSLDFLMAGVYLSDVYGVSEDDLKAMVMAPDSTVNDLFAYMEAHATIVPTDAKESLKAIS